MTELQFKLPVFEGPLDLLLHLIAKHKLNIYDIEISELLTQYLQYIEEMKLADLEVASDFLEMAARLVYIKTVSLLPKSEEAEELKKELTGQLLELQTARYMAALLRERCLFGQIYLRKAAEPIVDMTYRRSHDRAELLSAMVTAGQKKLRDEVSASAFSGIVKKRMVSVTSRIFYVLKKLYRTGEAEFSAFYETEDRSELVATFLAMLELLKSKRIRLSEDNSRVFFDRNQRETPQTDIQEVWQ